MGNYYDKDGSPLALDAFSEKFGDIDYKRVALTELPSGKRVSTIWLGLDHRHGEGAPLIFESMVFDKDSWSDLDAERYSTLEQAQAGHSAMVEKWSSK